MALLKKLFSFFKSLRLTFALIIWLAAVAGVSTFIPAFRFFRSPVFLVPAGLFFINLLLCAIFRFIRELQKKKCRSFGPDIIHGGLLFFMIAAFFSAFNRWEGLVTLKAGQQAMLPDGTVVLLNRVEYAPYDDSRPRSWTSYLTVTAQHEALATDSPLEVNRPLKLNNFSLYQHAWGIADGEAYSVIQAVQDPAYTLVLLSFAVCGLGIVVTLFYKLRKQT